MVVNRFKKNTKIRPICYSVAFSLSRWVTRLVNKVGEFQINVIVSGRQTMGDV